MEFVCFVWIPEQRANFALHSIQILVFITEVESAYSAVGTESLYNTDMFRLRKVNPLTPGIKSLRATLPDEICYWGFCFLNRAFH
jgi:hypothetical protein